MGDKTPPEQPDPKFPSLLFPPAPPVPPHPRGWNIPLCPSSSALGVSPPPRRYQQEKKKKTPSAAMQSQDFSPPIPRGKIRGHIPSSPPSPPHPAATPALMQQATAGVQSGVTRGHPGPPRAPQSPVPHRRAGGGRAAGLPWPRRSSRPHHRRAFAFPAPATDGGGGFLYLFPPAENK